MAEKKDEGELFVCEYCGEEFIMGRPFDEAAEEFKRDFGKPLEMHAASLVCDECYKKLIQFHKHKGD